MFKINIQTATLLKACLLVSATLIGSSFTTSAFATDGSRHGKTLSAKLPLVKGWYNGKPILYLTTDASDPNAAKDMGVNYVPQLANALSSQPSSVDDIFAVTNFKQGNIIPSAPIPTGPDNKDPDYTPLWQVSTITWKDAQQAYTLKSEKEALDAQAAGKVDITQTNIVVNCPVIYTPDGGILPNTKIYGMR
jgi:hypothetical protein